MKNFFATVTTSYQSTSFSFLQNSIESYEKIKDFFINFFSAAALGDYSRDAVPAVSTHSVMPRIKRQFKLKKDHVMLLPLIIIAILVIAIVVLLMKNSSSVKQANIATTAQQVQLMKPLATETLNKSFDFPVKDSLGNQVASIKYELQTAELRNEIVVQGQPAIAVAGKEFLIINLKLTNNSTKQIGLGARDYIRLVVNNAADRLAPDIHNDPVNVQPISTKYTRVGFPINATDKKLVLEIGEITAKKTSIPLQLK